MMNHPQRFCALAFTLLLALSSPAAPAQTAQPTEIIPTAQRAPATWRFTFQRPASDWRTRTFDDGSWQQAPAPFGTGGTPGIAPRSRWSSADIYLRREIAIPQNFPEEELKRAQLMMFHDEDVEVYFDGVPAARERGFVSAYEPVEIFPDALKVLKPGAKILVAVHCHQTTGGQGIDLGIAVVPPGYASEAAAARRRERYRDFAMSHPGDRGAGEKLFNNVSRIACTNCHTADGKGDKAGPDLSTIGDKFPRRELIDAVLLPSAQIAIGFSTTTIRTKAGDVYQGVVKDSNDKEVSIIGSDAKLVKIPVGEIDRQVTSPQSLMPDGLESTVSFQEFTDLIDYLSSLKVPASAQIARQGQPVEIPELSKPATLTRINSEENHFNHPCWMGQIPGMPGRFLIAEHETGRIWLLDKSSDRETKALFADFRSEIRPGGATGLLGIAFHPRFRENHKYYIQHERQEGRQMFALVSEKIASDDFLTDSGKPSKKIIEFRCSTDVHSGGGIEFGPDGYLYIGMGDTGPQGDPQGHGQDLSTPLGKMLRIDVDHASAEKPYSIPRDNPFVNDSHAAPEIWAYGFREPWRFSFDPATGELWVGDVGQDRIEEVDIVRKGENYGWNVFEGFEFFSSRYRRPNENFVPPVFAYNRTYGNSITGGYVYRGKKAPQFNGVYVCADYTSKRVWAITQSDRTLHSIFQIALCPQSVSSFGRDEQGELYAVGYEGNIYRIDLGSAQLPTH